MTTIVMPSAISTPDHYPGCIDYGQDTDLPPAPKASWAGHDPVAVSLVNGKLAGQAGAASHFAGAVQHHRAGRLGDAAAGYRQVIELEPGHVKAITNLGVLLLDEGKPDEAIACYCQAIALRPNFADAHGNLGTALQRLGRMDEAAVSYRQAIQLDPAFVDAHYNLGIVLRHQGRLDGAVASYRRALHLRPDHAQACNNLGIALQQQGRLDQAMASYRQAITLRPTYPEAHSNLGGALQQAGQLEAAVACYRQAIALHPGYADAHCNLALALLKGGTFGEGWAEYEWRWQTPEWAGLERRFAQPQWGGEAAPGKTLLIHAEQGFGDTLQFCRYASLAVARGLRVVMEVQRPLVRLLQSLEDVAALVARGDALPPFDLQCPMLSLPLVAGTDLATIPNTAPYLRADPALAERWRSRLSGVAGKRVGLVWAGAPTLNSDARRSLPSEQLAPLFALPDLGFVSLQKGGQPTTPPGPLVDIMDEIEDFADTAAVIATLDLVISVDTAVAHLAGALGKPVWLLDRFDSDWRWLTGRRDSAWYPTLRLFRQACPGDWGAVLDEVCAALRAC